MQLIVTLFFYRRDYDLVLSLCYRMYILLPARAFESGTSNVYHSCMGCIDAERVALQKLQELSTIFFLNLFFRYYLNTCLLQFTSFFMAFPAQFFLIYIFFVLGQFFVLRYLFMFYFQSFCQYFFVVLSTINY